MPKDFVKDLLDITKTKKYDWIILADDSALQRVSDAIAEIDSNEDRENLAKLLLPLTKKENRLTLGSKAGLHLLCQKYSILSPKSTVYDRSTAPEKSLGNISFPLLLKVDRSMGGSGVFLCKNIEEVNAQLSKLNDFEKQNLLFQEYIDGDNCSVEAIFNSGVLVSYAFSVVLKTMGGPFGVSVERRYESRPPIESILKNIGSSFGIHGISSMTFIFNRIHNQYFLIESDLRPNVWFPLARFAGVDFSRSIAEFFSGIKAGNNKVVEPVVIRHFSRSISTAIEHFDFKEIFKWVFNINRRWRYICFYDRKMFYTICVRYAGNLFKKYTKAPPIEKSAAHDSFRILSR